MLWAAVACLVLSAVAVVTVDEAFSRASLAGDLPGDVRKGLNLAEVFAHGAGVAFISLAFFVLDSRRRLVPRLICLPVVTGLAGQSAKWLITRKRPHQFLETELPAALDTFLAFPGCSSTELQSMPSGHTATAVGLAIALSWLYPRGTLLFAFFATLAALQRVSAGAHFVSDTLAGAAIAFAVAGILARPLFWDA